MRARSLGRWSVLPVLVAACVGDGAADRDPGDDTDATADSDGETDPPDTDPGDTDNGGDTDLVHDSDTDVAAPGPSWPALRWDDALAGLCDPPTPCRSAWTDPYSPGLEIGAPMAATASRGVGSAHDPRVTVVVDLQRDVDGDGSWRQRGLVLTYDAASGRLVDHPDLPDDFVALGLLDEAVPWVRTLALGDLDGDGLAEAIVFGPQAPLRRWDAGAGKFVGDPRLRDGLPPELAMTAWGGAGIADLDNDGQLDVLVALAEHGVTRWGPFLSFLQAGGGRWDVRNLHVDDGRSWALAQNGFGQLWDAAGGVPLQFRPGDSLSTADPLGSCWTPALGGRTTEGYPEWTPCDVDKRPGGLRGTLNAQSPMGVSVGTHDLNHDGAHEIVLTTTDRQLNILTPQRAFDVDPVFDDVGGWVTPPHVGACDPDDVVSLDTDGVGWTCPTLAGKNYLVPWASEGVDLDQDGWRDLVVAAGEDVARDRCLLTGELCVRSSPVGVWRNLGADPSSWVPLVGLPLLAWWPLDERDGDRAPVGNYAGMRLFDLDGDSDLDVLLSGTQSDPAAVFLDHTAHGNHGLCPRLVGTVSNPLAIGALVEVTADGVTQHFQLGGSGGPTSWSAPALCVGVGDAADADVVVRWPSGLVEAYAAVAAVAEGERGEVELVEPAWFTLSRPDGTPTSRREALGEPVVVTVCAVDPAARPAGAPATFRSDVSVALTATSYSGAASVLAPRSGAPAGCSSWTLSSSGVGASVLTATVGGVVMPAAPRVRWVLP